MRLNQRKLERGERAMGRSLKKVWLWTKLVVVIILVAWVILFFVFNSGNRPRIWLIFGAEPEVSLDVIIPITALATLVIYYVISKIRGMLHQLRVVHQEDKAREREMKMEALARQVEQKMSTPEPPTRPG